jgi:prepilin-type N-terminal cleavage/methylation domain-containing protein
MTNPDSDTQLLPDGHGEKGFSMIEMLIAIVVITVGLVALVAISVHVSRANSASNNLNVLAATAQDQVDRLRTAIWTLNKIDPMLEVGGSLAPASVTPLADGRQQALAVASSQANSYTYTLGQDNHSAVVSNTPVGNLNISWQVRQGEVPNMRYVTIRIVQADMPPGKASEFVVSTIICRN